MTSYEENPEKRPNLVKFSAAFDTVAGTKNLVVGAVARNVYARRFSS